MDEDDEDIVSRCY